MRQVRDGLRKLRRCTEVIRPQFSFSHCHPVKLGSNGSNGFMLTHARFVEDVTGRKQRLKALEKEHSYNLEAY